MNASLDGSYTVLIVLYNSKYWLEQNTLIYNEYKKIIFIDNASSDGSANFIKEKIPKALIIENKKNIGFGAACNQGVRLSDTKHILLLNPDCECNADQIEQLIASANLINNAAIVAPQIITRSDQLEISYRMSHFRWKAKQTQPAQGLLCVDFVTGACMLINKVKMNDISGFNEKYFLYYEDEDLCLRLRQLGYSIIVEPNIKIKHFARSGSKSNLLNTLRTEYIRGKEHTRSKILFYQLHAPLKKSKLQVFKLLLGVLMALPFRLIHAVIEPKYLARTLGRLIALIKI